MKTSKSHRRAFTLIELLVVISIVSLLISILLPALGKARASARSIQCASNLRQMGISTATYTSDYKQYIPFALDLSSGATFGGYCTSRSPGWYVRIADYLKIDVVDYWRLGPTSAGLQAPCLMTCPEKTDITYPNVRPVNYAPNAHSAKYAPAVSSDFRQGRIDQILKPTEKIWLLDMNSGIDPSRFTADNFDDAALNYGGFSANHNGVANVLYFDGHANNLSLDRAISLIPGPGHWDGPFWKPFGE